MNASLQRAGGGRRIRPSRTTPVVLFLAALVLLLCAAGPAAAYRSGALVWAKSSGARGHDRWFSAVAKAPKGMVYTAGAVATGGARGDDALVVKYRANGTVAWTRVWDGGGGASASDWARDAVSDSKGNLYVAATAGTPTGSELVTIKYDSSGKKQWEERLVAAAGYYTDPQAIALNPAGGVYVVGSQSNLTTGSAFIAGYEADGDQRWTRLFSPDPGTPSDGNKWASDVVADPAGSAYVAMSSYHDGVSHGLTAKLALADGATIESAEQYYAAGSALSSIALRGQQVVVAGWCAVVSQQEAGLVVRYDLGMTTDTTLVYDDPRGSDAREFLDDVAIGKGGAVFAAGFSNFPPPGGSGYYDSALVLRWNGSGPQAWAKLYKPAGAGAEVGTIVLDGSDNVFVGGVVDTNRSEENMLVARYSPSGTRKWVKTWHDTGTDDDWAGGLLLGASPTLYVAGGGSARGDVEHAVLLRFNR